MQKADLRRDLFDWFKHYGAYVSVDGQFGSTGKGVINGALAETFGDSVDAVTSNAGPNSGHTSYSFGEKIVLKQLPTFGVTAHRMYATPPRIYLNAGAIIRPAVLDNEVAKHDVFIWVNPRAAIITDDIIAADKANVSNIASTGQGVGPALQAKLARHPSAIVWAYLDQFKARSNLRFVSYPLLPNNEKIFIEVSQGFSLGLNHRFYPNVTTRECTVSQALADAVLPPTSLRKTVMTVRAHPIRVGDTENSSGPYYVDQDEISWSDIGVQPETTTVTGRVRRVFTWSDQQFAEALRANDPNVIFVNFLNYIGGPDSGKVNTFLQQVWNVYVDTLNREPDAILAGFGPTSSDIYTWKVAQ